MKRQFNGVRRRFPEIARLLRFAAIVHREPNWIVSEKSVAQRSGVARLLRFWSLEAGICPVARWILTVSQCSIFSHAKESTDERKEESIPVAERRIIRFFHIHNPPFAAVAFSTPVFPTICAEVNR